jgi:hypothetical protein
MKNGLSYARHQPFSPIGTTAPQAWFYNKLPRGDVKKYLMIF